MIQSGTVQTPGKSFTANIESSISTDTLHYQIRSTASGLITVPPKSKQNQEHLGQLIISLHTVTKESPPVLPMLHILTLSGKWEIRKGGESTVLDLFKVGKERFNGQLSTEIVVIGSIPWKRVSRSLLSYCSLSVLVGLLSVC